MAVVINGSGTVTGISVGGLPDGIVDAGTLATNSVDSAELIDGAVDDSHMASIKGRKNLIMNGNFAIWQRGTSFTSSGYTADRWNWAGGTGTVTRQAFTAGDEIADSPYYLRWAVTGNSQNIELRNNIEDVRTAAGKSCKLSFWAKSSTGTETLGWEVYQNFGSGGSSLTSAGGGTYTPTTSWAKYTFDVTMGSMTGKTIGTGSYIWVRVAQMATTNTPTLEFAGVQLEVGTEATDFEHRHYGEELALCQRYYQRWNVGDSSMVATGQCFSTTSGYVEAPLSQPFRVKPTALTFDSLSVWNSTGAEASGTLALAIHTGSTADVVRLNVSGKTNLGGAGEVCSVYGSGTGWLALDAEL